MAANEAYVKALRRMIQSLEEAEDRLLGRMHFLRRKRYRSQIKLDADRASQLKLKLCPSGNISSAACDDLSPRTKHARTTVDFKRGYFQTPCVTQVGGKLVDGVATPGANEHVRAVRQLRGLLLPLQPSQSIASMWTSNEQSFLTGAFVAWPHHHREPTNDEWESMCNTVVSCVETKKRRWVRLKCARHPWSPAEDDQLRILAETRSLGWRGIASIVSTPSIARFPAECLMRYQRDCNAGGTWDFRRWNADTHQALRQLVQELGENWPAIAERTAHRTATELKRKWHELQTIEACSAASGDGMSCSKTDRLLVLAAYCYSRRWSDVQWTRAMRHIPHPPHRMHQYIQTFDKALSPISIPANTPHS
ncbi:hypothetical protein DYB31_009811 [Aphanomyces astaci]|uniref:Myb-like domain-containing protein n=1 Tax=Aphanomyces astaci TaxID=112090 RepID=A0A397F1M0_APHAT|nr:hypothetical protein DYB31_009811 [Aphanomyces astaci]